MKQGKLFDPDKYHIRAKVCSRIRKMCRENKPGEKKIKSYSLKDRRFYEEYISQT